MKDMLPEQNNEQVSRRKFIGNAGKALLAFGIAILSACAPKESNTYLVKVQLSQSRSHFEPSTVDIPTGSQVVWQNLSIYPVTVTCDPSKVKSISTNNEPSTSAAYVNLPSGASPWDSGTLYPGQTWSHTFSTPGEYLYFSQYSQSPDLVGTVVVK